MFKRHLMNTPSIQPNLMTFPFFTSTSSVALEHLGILQTIQPWSLGIPRGNICEKRDSCYSPADNRVAIGHFFFFKSNSNIKNYKEIPAFEYDLIVSSVASPFESPPPFCPFCNWNKMNLLELNCTHFTY